MKENTITFSPKSVKEIKRRVEAFSTLYCLTPPEVEIKGRWKGQNKELMILNDWLPVIKLGYKYLVAKSGNIAASLKPDTQKGDNEPVIKLTESSWSANRRNWKGD